MHVRSCARERAHATRCAWVRGCVGACVTALTSASMLDAAAPAMPRTRTTWRRGAANGALTSRWAHRTVETWTVRGNDIISWQCVGGEKRTKVVVRAELGVDLVVWVAVKVCVCLILVAAQQAHHQPDMHAHARVLDELERAAQRANDGRVRSAHTHAPLARQRASVRGLPNHQRGITRARP
jgi:hypothetical protein